MLHDDIELFEQIRVMKADSLVYRYLKANSYDEAVYTLRRIIECRAF